MLSFKLSNDHLYLYLLYRGFTEILKKDRTQYGAGEDYVIGDVIADEWQQRVDNVVGGLEDVAEA